ncbi:helix-turn-helix transcriptional regulator [Acutalibacter caecimuris]|uniref:helix-turn-helix transcriptional regulator n=1 Tax=Acutalibacter caecimuris TaxID=3093657 RepID=UPI002AC9E725|nr:AraC family transcriptional regulator [Acutalibacter sp. M00118]
MPLPADLQPLPDEPVLLRQTEEDMRQAGGKALHQFGVHSTYRLHTHDFYELFLVPQGSAVHVVNGQTQLLTEGSLALIRPSDAHKYELLNDSDFEIINIGIPYPVFLRLCQYLGVSPQPFDAPPVSPLRVLSGSALRDARRKLLENQSIANPDISYLHMLSVFPYLVGLFLAMPEEEQRLPQWLSQLLDQMDRPENFVPGLPRMLALANLSQEHLNRSFRRYLGVTPTAFVNAKRLSHAVDLLLAQDIPVLEVSALCGFNSPSLFYRLFTQRYGCPPKAFRQTFRDGV